MATTLMSDSASCNCSTRPGAAPTSNTLVFFGSCAGQPGFTAFVRNIISVLQESAPAIIGVGLTPDAISRALSELEAWSALPDAAIWYGLNWAEGVKP